MGISDSCQEKEQIRHVVRKKRSELDSVWIDEKSGLIQQALLSLPEFAEASMVCCYLSMPFEARTDQILARCWDEDRTVCVPAFRRDVSCYDLAKIERNTPVVEGPWKVPEPLDTVWISVDEVDFMVVPGMAFDVRGGRLGHGGGHYDRIMKSGQNPLFIIGLAFEFQLFDRVPMGEKDEYVDVVVTEERVIRGKRSRFTVHS